MNKINVLKKLLEPQKKAIIIPHARPDADAIGSSLAWNSILKKLGLNSTIISPNDFPNFLNWMPGTNDILVYQSEKGKSKKDIKKDIENHIRDTDMIFCIDFSSLNRVNELSDFIKSSNAKKIIIDHHLNPENFEDLLFWDINSSATALIIYKIIKNLKIINLLDKDIAEALYAGIITDTGNFQNPNTTSKAHQITSELIDIGIDIVKVNDNIYKSNSINKIKFLGFALSNRLKILNDYNVAYIWLTRADWLKYNLKVGDTEGLVNYALSIKDINFAALISEQTDFIRISLRSRKNLVINDIAKQYFDGGGHANAAGGKSTLSLDETIDKFEEIIKKENRFKIK